MRLPKLRQLTEAQKRVYLYAPTDRHTLVSGPPGTGKTLIACLRAVELKKKNVPVVLCMFSRVLARYSSNAGGEHAIQSTTVHAWFYKWWKASGVPPHPTAQDVTVDVEYAERETVKAVGARWDPGAWSPWRKKKGAWVVNGQVWHDNPQVFAHRSFSHSPSTIDGKPYVIDWHAVAEHLLEHESRIPAAALNLGTILVDEGQDFSPGFYKTLRVICAIAEIRGGAVLYPPRCFVLADENQQITDENSTLADITRELKIADDNRYALFDNFRNSREIAELAIRFFANVGDLPRLPARLSEKPVYSEVAVRKDAVTRIVTWLRNNPGKEVGVLVFDDATRGALTEDLHGALSVVKGRTIRVQSYSSVASEASPAENLLFDAGDVVTVLNMQSCKGLEFDAVFVVDPWKARIGIYGVDRFKMQMFVAVSRARDWVHVIDCGVAAKTAPHQACMPGEEYLENEGVRGNGTLEVVVEPLRGVEGAAAILNGAVEKTEWELGLARLVEEHNLRTTDMRARGGALWVAADGKFARELEVLGFTFVEKRSAWWRK